MLLLLLKIFTNLTLRFLFSKKEMQINLKSDFKFQRPYQSYH